MLIVAAPLRDVDSTLHRLLLIELLVTASCSPRSSGSASGSSGSACGRWRRSAKTADAIAAGDLSQRVERADERTEVGRLGLALNAMLGRIEDSGREASERLRRFVADASHELRTPLAAVRAYAELFDARGRPGPTTSRAR